MSEFWFRIFYAIAWFFFNLIHPNKPVGRDQVPEGGCLLCGNHTRYSDPLFIMLALGRKDHPYVMAKAELLRYPVLGWILKKVGVFGVDRGKADVKAVKEALRILKDGNKLLLFPEGTRFRDGESQGAKTGVAMLALRTGVPIVPIWMPAKKKWFRRTPVVFGEPYYPEMPEGAKPTPADYHRVADDLLARVMALGEQYHGN